MKVIAFDLHDVLFGMDYKKVASIAWQASPKLPLIAAPLHPRFWANFIKLIRKDAVGEEYVVRMAQWHPALKPYIATGISIINAQKPNKPVVDITKLLKKNGYKLIVFSNIGELAYKDLWTQFPDIMNLFDDAVFTQEKDDYVRKPMAGAFEKLLSKAGAPPQEILFIDNKQKNIHAAQQQGINAIHYKTPGNLLEQIKQYTSI